MNTFNVRCEYTWGIKAIVWMLTILSWIVLICTLPFSLIFCVKVIQEYEKAAICKLGRLSRTKGPGMILVLPFIESFTKIDMRSKIMDVPPQEVITKDSVTVSVDAVVYYHVSDPLASIINVQSPQKAAGRLAQITLTKVLGTRILKECLSDKDAMSQEVQSVLDVATTQWGIKVERVEIEDVSLPKEMTRAMAAEAEASREAKAKLIKAEGEIKAAHFLQKASASLSESPYALQLKYLQTLGSLANAKDSTIVFPVPIDIEFYKHD